VRLCGAGQLWTVLGSDESRGLVAEGLSLTADTHGPQTAGFAVKRDPTVLHPDLGPFAACDVEIGGVPVWSGRVWETPGTRGEERSMSVSGRGWQSHLDDDVLRRGWVHTRISDWRDQRSYLGADLTKHVAPPVVGDDRGVIGIGWPNGSPVATGHFVGITLDTLTWGSPFTAVAAELDMVNPHAGMRLWIRAHDTETPHVFSGFDDFVASYTTSNIAGVGSGPSYLTGEVSTARRYATIMMVSDVTGTVGADHILRIRRVVLYQNSALRGSNASSLLKASDVVRGVLSAGVTPLLSSDQSAIEDTTFSIPHFAPDGYQAPRAFLEAANAYHDWLWGVDARRRLFFRPRPAAPLYEVGEWSGSAYDDQSTGSAEPLYNRVIVEGQGAGGETIHVARTATSPLLDRHGLTRTMVLQVGAVLTTASAEAIGDAWLAEHARAQMRGSLRVVGMGGVRTTEGRPVHPSELLIAPGQRIRFMHMVDPDTGGQGRDGTIASVSYDHDSETASVEIDSERGRFDALLARLGAIQEVTLS
jgi:hypothetical protein